MNGINGSNLKHSINMALPILALESPLIVWAYLKLISLRGNLISLQALINFYLVFVLKISNGDLTQNTPFQLALIPLLLYFFSVMASLCLERMYRRIGRFSSFLFQYLSFFKKINLCDWRILRLLIFCCDDGYILYLFL